MAPNNPLSTWGNEKTMNLNPLILTNIQSSPYFKVNLYELKTYHEVIDEIYYKVSHLEPWEKGSRKTAGQTGMCGGVRGVGAGGIVSSAYCLLYKLFTLKLTRKQLNGLLTHPDSPYIRGLGFMYIRYTQAPQDLWSWFEDYLYDEEEVDAKAGGGGVMTIGEMLRQWLTKLEWFSTLFPRIPVPVQKSLDTKMRSLPDVQPVEEEAKSEPNPDEPVSFGEAERQSSLRGDKKSPESDGRSERNSRRSSPTIRRSPHTYRKGSPPKRSSPPRRSPPPRRSSPPRRSPPPRRSSPPKRSSPPRPSHRRSPSNRLSPPPYRRSSPPRRSPRRSPPRRRSSPDRTGGDFSRELAREKERQKREKEGDGSHERHKDRSHDKRHRDSEKRSRHRSRSVSREKRKHKDREGRREKTHSHRHRNGNHH